MKYELLIEYVEFEEPNLRHFLGRIERDSKEEILDFIMEMNPKLGTKHFKTEYTLYEKI